MEKPERSGDSRLIIPKKGPAASSTVSLLRIFSVVSRMASPIKTSSRMVIASVDKTSPAWLSARHWTISCA